jgi:ATP-binding cassette subfamily C protein CydD
VQGVEGLDEYITLYQPLRFLAVMVPIMVALVVLAIDPFSVIVLIVTGPLVVLFLALIGSRARAITERRFLELGWMSASFLDLLQGLATLKMFGRSREQIDTIRDITRQYGTTTMEVLRTAFETAFVLEMSTTIATALVAVEIGLRLVDGGISYGPALGVLILTPEFFSPLRQLSLRYHAGAAGKATAERIFAILDTPVTESARARSSVPVAKSRKMDISFAHVTFSYPGTGAPVLSDFSLSIGDGETVALVGETGAGKSTVANLLLRFLEPDGGTVSAGGVHINTLDIRDWRSCFAWVPQRPHLFYGSVAQNIRLARPDATAAQVADAARLASAHDFISLLPQGYDTPIGENGARLSGGERQRLAIARAFLKDAPVLVLDEATSHLDRETEAQVQEALERLMRGRTALIISHRLELTKGADRIVVLGGGHAAKSSPNTPPSINASRGRPVATPGVIL